MTVSLADIEFEYDFFSIPLPDGSTLIINRIDEDFITDDGEESAINAYNLVVAPEDGSDNINCSSVIGMSNDYFSLESGYDEYVGKVLTDENIAYCTLEIADE